MKKIITPGTDAYRATCGECGCHFSYERNDVRHNYLHGGEEVSCPHCGHGFRHFGVPHGLYPRGAYSMLVERGHRGVE